MLAVNAIIIDADAKTIEPIVIEYDPEDNILEATRHITGHNDPGITEMYGQKPLVWFLCEDIPLTKEAPMASFRDYGGFVGKTLIIGYDDPNDVALDCPFPLDEVRAETEFYFGETFRRW